MKKSRRITLAKRCRWRVEWLVQVLLEAVVARLPATVAFRLGEGLGALVWPFAGARRRTILRNLRIALAEDYDLPTLRRMARETFIRTTANLLSVAHTARISLADLEDRVSLERSPLIDQALAEGRGLVMLPPHMGNWEVLSRVSHLYAPNVKAGAFYRPLNNPLVNSRIVAQREADGTRLFSKRETFHQATGFLRDGGLLGILADQRVGRQGELVPFFGRLTRASPLPSLLARRSKCQVVAISMTTTGPAQWRIRFHPVAEPYDTASCFRGIEQAMRESPLDVFWFQERWKVYVRSHSTIRDWLGSEPATSTKPHRALLWLVGLPGGWELPEAWRHPDVMYEAVLAENQPTVDCLPQTTRIHRVPPAARTLHRQLAAIDAAATLPVDFVLSPDPKKNLANACRREAIPLISLSTTVPARG